MRTFEKWKAWVFIGSLVLVALLINYSQMRWQGDRSPNVLVSRQDEQKVRTQSEDERKARLQAEMDEATAAQRAAEKAAAEHARFLERHLNKGFARTPGIESVAVVASSEELQPNSAVRDALTDRIKTAAVEMAPSLFRPEFISDGLLNAVFAGSNEILTKLELKNILDVLVLARQSVRYSQNPSLENVTTANMRLEVATFSIAANMKNHTWTFEANGAGFTTTAARALAEERLIKEIAKDTKMTLPH